jgi:hypothetical protein
VCTCTLTLSFLREPLRDIHASGSAIHHSQQRRVVILHPPGVPAGLPEPRLGVGSPIHDDKGAFQGAKLVAGCPLRPRVLTVGEGTLC